MSGELPVEVEILRADERKTATKTLPGAVTASDSTKQSLSTPSIRSRSGIIHLPHSTELPIPKSPKIVEGSGRGDLGQESEATHAFSEASPDSPLCEPQFSRPQKGVGAAAVGKDNETSKHKTHFNNDENQNVNEDASIEVDDQKLFQTEKVSPINATSSGGVGGGEKNRSTDFEISNTSYSFALSPFFGRLGGGGKEGGEGHGSRRKGGGGDGVSIAGDEEMFSGDVISEVSAAVHASGSIHRGYNDTGDYSDMDVSAPKNIRARSRARKRRNHKNNQSSTQHGGKNSGPEGRSGTRQRSSNNNYTSSSTSLFRSCWKVVWRKVRTPSVVSLTALMVILCVAVSFAAMLAVVGALTWTSSTHDRQQQALLAALHTTRMRAAASEGFKLLQQSITTLDNVQLLTLQRDSTRQMLDVSGRSLVEGFEEQAVGDDGDVPAKTYAPTSDASALLQLGPLIDELTTKSISFVFQSGPESTHQIGRLAREAGYVLQNDGNGSVSDLGWARVPRFVVGLEDGRYAKTGPFPRTGYWGSVSGANYTQYVLVVDGDHRNQTFSGDFDNAFPRLNMSLSSEDLESIPPSLLLNDTLWPSGGVRPRLYSSGIWSLEMNDAGLEGDPNALITMDGFSPPLWIGWPGIFDAANLSTGVVSRIKRNSPLGYIGSVLEYARKSNWYNTSRSLAPRQKILHGLSIDTDSNIGYSPCLTLAAPLYFRRKLLTTEPGNATRPLGGSQKSRVTYSSSGDNEVDNFINENYVFVGVTSALIPIDGLSSHLASVIIGLTGAISDIDKNNPPFQLFLLRGDFVWASSLSHLSTIVTMPDPSNPPQDEKGRSECAGSTAGGREAGTRWCLHTIQSFGHQPLSSAKKALPAIVAPPPLLPSSVPSSASVADRAKDFMRGSSSFRVLFPATSSSSPTDASTSFLLADSSSYQWHATYSLMDTGAFASSGSGASTAPPPFVLLLLSREELAASEPSSALANNDGGNNNNISHFTIIIIVSVAILVVIAAIVVVVSRIVLRPLRTVAEIMSLSLHLADESISSCDSRTAALIEKFREKMKDRTLSRWEEVRAIQKGYWMMSEEIQKLKAYIPEHLREEVVAMRSSNRRRSLRILGTSSTFSQKTDTLESGTLGLEQSNVETPETLLSPNQCVSPAPQVVSPAPPTSIFEDVNQNREPNIEKGTEVKEEVAVATTGTTIVITTRRTSDNKEDPQSAQMQCEFAADGSRLVAENKQREGNAVSIPSAVVRGGESCAAVVDELAAPSPEAKVANVLQGPPPPLSQLPSSPPLPSSRPPLPLTKATLMGAAATAAPESLSTTVPPKPKGGLAGGEVNVGGKAIGMHSIVSLGVVLDSLHGGDEDDGLEEEEETSRGGAFGSSTSTAFASGRRRRKGGARSATDGGADDTDASQFTSNGSSVASPKSNYQRPVFFADSALVDRDITVVHINIVHFHYYARSTHSPSISRDYEEFISFVHMEARRFGGMLESFSGDKVWVSFNASSKCVNGPVAAAYYAYSVTSTVNNAVIRKGAAGAKAYSHPIFTNRAAEKYFRIAPYGITCGVATGRAFVGPLGNSSVKRHTIISNAVSEAAALERQALRYPGCNVLIGGDMIPAIEGYCQYLLVDATLLPGSEGRRRRIACLKGPMLAAGKDPEVVKRWILPSDNNNNNNNNNNNKESAVPVAHNPYRTINEAMNAFLEGQNEVCKRLVRQAGFELIAPASATLRKPETGQSGEGEDGQGEEAAKKQLAATDDPLVAIRAIETLWEAKERAAFVSIIIKFLQVLLTMGVEGRSYRSQIGESHVPIPHALCCYTLGS